MVRATGQKGLEVRSGVEGLPSLKDKHLVKKFQSRVQPLVARVQPLVLGQVRNKRERSSPVRPPGVEKTSMLRSRDPVASRVRCGPHGGMNSKRCHGRFLG
jgi:hypothetical protein